ncbi:uncharacterized protein LOC101235313 isoform X1 [Hydra vulgaris]|uniref:uncharacterized protein LOC101235313 isoform X1 n=1 Tax=Hydra vulgaris TaxID=6087 RepID=UPI0006415952|nr:uncharacterized protein LOC101235313 isoform X1 [Hydra vulgaris]
MIIWIFLIFLHFQVYSMPISEVNLSLPDCNTTGPLDINVPEILESTKEIEFVEATFLLNSPVVYYLVKFCKRDHLCFVTTIEKKVVDLESKNMINDINLWIKLIGVIKGYVEIEPYIKLIYENQHDSDFFECKNGRNYKISGAISEEDKQKIKNVKKNFKPKCINDEKCTRHCLHYANDSLVCSEMKLTCSFNTTCFKMETHE